MSEVIALSAAEVALVGASFAGLIGVYVKMADMARSIGRLEGKLEILCKERGVKNV